MVHRLVEVFDDLRREFLDEPVSEFEGEQAAQPAVIFGLVVVAFHHQHVSVDNLSSEHDDAEVLRHVSIEVLEVFPNNIFLKKLEK